MPLNVLFAWVWILAGLLSGAAIGVCFHDDSWLGGYGSWRRRMLRLGHISFIGTGLLNLAYGLTLATWPLVLDSSMAGAAFMVGAVTMPLVCFLSACRQEWRRLFFIPVASLVWATGIVVWRGMQ